MRIAILSYEYPPETGYGGIGTYSYYQARALAKLGHDVHVFAGSTRDGTFHSEHDGVKVTRTKREGWLHGLLGDARRMRAWWFQNRVATAMCAYRVLLKEHERKPFDFVEAPECGADAMVSTTLMRVPTAIKLHSPARLIMGIYDVPKLDRELTAFAEQLGINQTQVLMSCSQFLADEVTTRMHEPKPIHVVPNGIDVPMFDRDDGIDVHAKFGLPRDKQLIFFANRMEERKGIHIVQKMVEGTLAKYRDIAFVFAGSDLFGWMEKKILPWVKDHQLQSRFFYLGRLGLPEVRACLKASSIFLIPSLWENCPYSCLEAMTAGRAIVSSDCGGMPELIEDGRTGVLARNGDPASFVQALTRMIEDKGLQERCGAAARAEVEKRLTDVVIAGRSVDLYRAWLDKRPAGGERVPRPTGTSVSPKEVAALRTRVAVLTDELTAARAVPARATWREWFGLRLRRASQSTPSDGDDKGAARGGVATCIVALVGLLLSLWAAGAFWIASPVATTHDYQLTVVREPAWIRRVVVDGRALTPSAAAARGSWQFRPLEPWLFAVCEQLTAPTTLSMRGSTLQIELVPSTPFGVVEVRRDGELVDTVQSHPGGVLDVVRTYGWCFDLGATCVLAAVLAVAWWSIRPMRGGRHLTAWLVFLVASVHTACWLTHEIGLTADSPGYVEAWQTHLRGYPSYFPPGYGFVIAAATAGGALSAVALTFVQHAAIVVLALLLHRHFRDVLGERWSFAGALLGALAFPTLFGAQAAMSESCTCVMMGVAAVLAFRGAGRRSVGAACLAGLFAGLAGATRVIPLAVLCPLLLAAGLFPRRLRSWRRVVVSVGAAIGVVAAILLNNGLRGGSWEISDGAAKHLYNHFIYQQKLFDAEGVNGRQLAAAMPGRNPCDLPHWEASTVLKETLEPLTVDRLMMGASWEAAKTVSWARHLAFTSALTWKNLATSAVPTMVIVDGMLGNAPTLSHPPLLPNSVHATALATRLARACEMLWKPLCILFAAALFVTPLLRRRRLDWVAWIWLVWAYMFVSSAVEYELPRYNVAVAPFVVMMAVGTMSVLMTWIRERIADVKGASSRDAG